MTTIELVDTAVKIGLGALIAAVSTLLGIKLKARTAADQERRKRRLDILERCAQDFEAAFQVFVRLFAKYSGYLFPPVEPKGIVGAAAMNLIRTRTWEKIQAEMGTEVPAALHSLHAVDASLLLIGATAASKCAEQFRLAATDLQSGLIMIDDLEGRPTPNRETLARLSQATSQARLEFYNALRLDFERL